MPVLALLQYPLPRAEGEGGEMTPQERYERDPQFHALVNVMRQYIIQAQFTPTEIREAAMLAAIQHESYQIRHIHISKVQP